MRARASAHVTPAKANWGRSPKLRRRPPTARRLGEDDGGGAQNVNTRRVAVRAENRGTTLLKCAQPGIPAIFAHAVAGMRVFRAAAAAEWLRQARRRRRWVRADAPHKFPRRRTRTCEDRPRPQFLPLRAEARRAGRPAGGPPVGRLQPPTLPARKRPTPGRVGSAPPRAPLLRPRPPSRPHKSLPPPFRPPPPLPATRARHTAPAHI